MLAAKRVLHAGLEAALFGRMVTSDPDANTDAAIHVAHSFTVHAEEAETDYFTVVDELETGSGAGGIFDTEITTGLFYLYVVIDVPGLIANLGGDAALAGKVVEHLTHLMATVSPGAKKGSTAPYAYAAWYSPRPAIASRVPSPTRFATQSRPQSARPRGGSLSMSVRLDGMYGAEETRQLAAVEQSETAFPGVGALQRLDDLARALATEVMGA